MSKEIPFDDDVMTLIMGMGGPSEPGQHGRKEVPMPEKDTIDLITQIRDLCEEFLLKCDKQKDEKSDKESEDSEEKDSEDEVTEEEPEDKEE